MAKIKLNSTITVIITYNLSFSIAKLTIPRTILAIGVAINVSKPNIIKFKPLNEKLKRHLRNIE
jgi:hypothetical protein